MTEDTDSRNSEIETTARLECRHVQRVSLDTYSVSKICSIWDCYFTLFLLVCMAEVALINAFYKIYLMQYQISLFQETSIMFCVLLAVFPNSTIPFSGSFWCCENTYFSHFWEFKDGLIKMKKSDMFFCGYSLIPRLLPLQDNYCMYLSVEPG